MDNAAFGGTLELCAVLVSTSFSSGSAAICMTEGSRKKTRQFGRCNQLQIVDKLFAVRKRLSGAT
jgi:hypothetical protein